MDDLYYYFREKNELVFIQESDSEENTIEYSIFPVTRIGDIDIMKSERIFSDLSNPRDGGWFTFEDDISDMDENELVSTVIGFAYDIPEGETITVYKINEYDINWREE